MDNEIGAAVLDAGRPLTVKAGHETAAGGVALCFKVPFSFRQWFKLQAVSRNITMTEFLMQAAQWYSAADSVRGSSAGLQQLDQLTARGTLEAGVD